MKFTLKSSVALAVTLFMFAFTVPIASAQSLSVVRKQPTSSSAMQLVGGDPSRASILIENVGSVNVSINKVSTVTTTTGFVLGPSQQALCVGVTDSFYAIAASSTADLRVTTTTAPTGAGYSRPLPSCSISRLSTTGGAINTAASTTVGMSDGAGNIVPGNVLVYFLTTAITANSTTTATAAGSMAVTSNATGLGAIFQSDGSKWQLVAASSISAHSSSTAITIATTSTSDMYFSCPVTGVLTGIDFSSLDALSASDTNYITYTAVNLGQSGVGTTAMLAVSDANTTKATGGTALVALARRQLTIHGTAGNLAVVKGDVIRVRATATGTLAGTVTLSRVFAYFTKLS